MDAQFGADGNLYMLTYGNGFFVQSAQAGMYRWSYVKGQRAPNAVMNANRTDGAVPLTVQFSSEGTRDPDPGDALSFEWDFDGNGSVDSTDPNPTYTYTTVGVYTARLVVKDPAGKSDVKTLTITAGNTTPTVTINTPVDGDFFEWGESIPYTVSVTDPEDGVIDCARVQVTFSLVHDQHAHAGETKTGCSGVLATNPNDATHGGSIAAGVSASYTDLGANGQPRADRRHPGRGAEPGPAGRVRPGAERHGRGEHQRSRRAAASTARTSIRATGSRSTAATTWATWTRRSGSGTRAAAAVSRSATTGWPSRSARAARRVRSSRP